MMLLLVVAQGFELWNVCTSLGSKSNNSLCTNAVPNGNVFEFVAIGEGREGMVPPEEVVRPINQTPECSSVCGGQAKQFDIFCPATGIVSPAAAALLSC